MSPLGSLLFLFSINDSNFAFNKVKMIHFADYTHFMRVKN